MLSTESIRKLLDDPSLSDDQIEDVRAACHVLAELMLEAWRKAELEKVSSSEIGSDSTPNLTRSIMDSLI
jgi:hypothetical protein